MASISMIFLLVPRCSRAQLLRLGVSLQELGARRAGLLTWQEGAVDCGQSAHPERARPCSWLVFTLMWLPFKLSPRSTPFSLFSLERSKEDRDAVFLSDSPVEGAQGHRLD